MPQLDTWGGTKVVIKENADAPVLLLVISKVLGHDYNFIQRSFLNWYFQTHLVWKDEDVQ